MRLTETDIYKRLKIRYNRWVWKNLPPCKEIVKLLSESQDRKLSLREKIITKLHLAACVPCVNYLNQIEFLHGAMHIHEEKSVEIDTTIKMSPESRERIKNLLKSSIMALLSIM